TLDQVRQPIERLLRQERTREARRRYVDSLKARTKVTMRLEPPRLAVSAGDGRPVRGRTDAPVEIIEFSDFECPFCQRAAPTISKLLATYGDKVRFVYRHYPLPTHPNARTAAEAAACAHEQGQFWPFH